MRKVCVVITARPSYSRVKSVLRGIQNRDDLQLQLVVTGSALLDKFGAAVDYIAADGFEIVERVFVTIEGKTPTSMAKSTGLAVMELSTVFNNLQPDMVVTIADRYETIATSIAAAYQNIPLVHLQGGEITGNIDEKVRHANTKMADVHFASTEQAVDFLIRMGEDKEYVFHTGCPSIDLVAELPPSEGLPFDPVERYGGVGAGFKHPEQYLVVMQHPVTTEFAQAKVDVTTTLEVIHELGIPTYWFWPNVDAGSDGTSRGIRSFREHRDLPCIHFFKNMEPSDFLFLLKHSMCLVGNSSAGIRECSFLGTPVVNIGTRQNKRERATNVLDVSHAKDNIAQAIRTQLEHGRYPSSQLYGDGKSGDRIAELMSKVPLRFHKTLSY